MIRKKGLISIVAWIVMSFCIHEISHVIALWILGIPSHIELTMMSFGPVLITKWAFAPKDLLGLWFTSFFGPFFAGIVMLVVGKIRPEAYVAGEIQLLWAPFELMSVMLLLGSGNVLEMYVLLFIMVVIPLVFVLGWGFNKIDERNK